MPTLCLLLVPFAVIIMGLQSGGNACCCIRPKANNSDPEWIQAMKVGGSRLLDISFRFPPTSIEPYIDMPYTRGVATARISDPIICWEILQLRWLHGLKTTKKQPPSQKRIEQKKALAFQIFNRLFYSGSLLEWVNLHTSQLSQSTVFFSFTIASSSLLDYQDGKLILAKNQFELKQIYQSVCHSAAVYSRIWHDQRAFI